MTNTLIKQAIEKADAATVRLFETAATGSPVDASYYVTEIKRLVREVAKVAQERMGERIKSAIPVQKYEAFVKVNTDRTINSADMWLAEAWGNDIEKRITDAIAALPLEEVEE